jgi:hypothetical protein
MREFGNDYLRSNDNKNGNDDQTWTAATEEFDSAATAEGWAEYVASVSFWDPSNVGSEPEQDSVDIESASLLSGFSCTSTAGGSVYQVARAFWDLDDANPESGVGPMAGFPDGQNLGTTWILNQWSEFPPGVHDHADYECCQNGVNVRDFLHHASPTAEINTLIRHNCLDGQQ